MRLYVETNFIITISNPFDPYRTECENICDLVGNGRLELLVPRIAVLEANHRLKSIPDEYRRLLKPFDDFVRNGVRVGIDVLQDVKLEEIHTAYEAIIEDWNPMDDFGKVKTHLQVFELSIEYPNIEANVAAASTTGDPKNPYKITGMDLRILSSVVDHHMRSVDNGDALFCSTDKRLCSAAGEILELVGVSLPVTSSFSQAYAWAEGKFQFPS